MPEVQIADLFQIKARFLRSAHLERDFENPAAMDGYVLSPHARTGLERLTAGLAANSGQRTWRITGDYWIRKVVFRVATGARSRRAITRSSNSAPRRDRFQKDWSAAAAPTPDTRDWLERASCDCTDARSTSHAPQRNCQVENPCGCRTTEVAPSR